ncbi:alpha/beta fold hydrolase [Sphingosinicella sp. CPCC 101087]|uniref:alpha/beta fold hydrolase n=1 Tax=Sphingosinicella sp. CPCC 101087 TaxID=2497754 RepID=UPI00101DB663|nr:alpha/beta hydrolase [Sphingosinicella sp. CPCC 101087]
MIGKARSVPFVRCCAVVAAAALLAAYSSPSVAETVQPLGVDLERFEYPWPVETMAVRIGRSDGHMAFMDVRPESPNGRSVVLLHGKNFCGATWESTAKALLGVGYRVLIPDQVGFCKSSKPEDAQYSFAMMAHFTRALMDQREMDEAVIVGHSTGGMLAMHFALMYPDAVDRLVLINPLGLTDRMAEGVPYVPLSRLIEQERQTSYDSIRQYQLDTYYHGEWEPRYDRWVRMLAGQYASGDAVAVAQARTSEMILTQPVSQHLERLTMPVALMIGLLDTTTFGKGQAPDDVRRRLQPIPSLAPAAAARMPNAELITFPHLGHSPQVEAPDTFERRLLEVLSD